MPKPDSPHSSISRLRPSEEVTKRRKLSLLMAVAAAVVLFGVLLLSRPPKTQLGPSGDQATALITITDQGFLPATLSLKAGTTITWINQSSAPHRVAANPYPDHSELPELDSGTEIAPGGSYVFTLEQSGTTNYHSHQDPVKYTGTLEVE